MQKAEIAKTWTDEIKHKYLTKNAIMSEEEFFEQLDKIADGEYESESENQSDGSYKLSDYRSEAMGRSDI